MLEAPCGAGAGAYVCVCVRVRRVRVRRSAVGLGWVGLCRESLGFVQQG